MTNPAEYALNHWRPHETDAEHAERVEKAENSAAWFFAQATKPQRQAYQQEISDLRGLSGPRYDRAREAAKAAWEASTKAANDLFIRSCDEIMRDGELSEALGSEWDQLCAAQTEQVAA